MNNRASTKLPKRDLQKDKMVQPKATSMQACRPLKTRPNIQSDPSKKQKCFQHR